MVLSAVLAVTAVMVAEQIERSVTTTTPIVDVELVDAPSVSNDSNLAAAAGAAVTSVVLPSGSMAVTLLDGVAAVTTGRDEPAIELATSTIGDLYLTVLVDGVVIAESSDEVSYDWGDVTGVVSPGLRRHRARLHRRRARLCFR